MALAALIVAIVGAIAAAGSVLYAQRSVDEAARARRVSEQSLEEARKSRQIAEDADHRESAPDILLELGDRIAGEGIELNLTSVDQDVDSLTVTWVKGIDAKADRRVVGISDRPAGMPIRTMGHTVELPAVAAGAVHVLGVWLNEPDQAGGALLRFRCVARIKDRQWTLVREVTVRPRPRIRFV